MSPLLYQEFGERLAGVLLSPRRPAVVVCPLTCCPSVYEFTLFYIDLKTQLLQLADGGGECLHLGVQLHANNSTQQIYPGEMTTAWSRVQRLPCCRRLASDHRAPVACIPLKSKMHATGVLHSDAALHRDAPPPLVLHWRKQTCICHRGTVQVCLLLALKSAVGCPSSSNTGVTSSAPASMAASNTASSSPPSTNT